MKALVVIALLIASPALAEEPWETGVPADQQARANAIFAEGNTLFTQLAHAAALDKYKAAVAIWDHPMIRFNMAVTLIRLDRILEAADELERALQFGDKPFTPDLYEQARDYQTLIKKQLGYVEVHCDQPSTHVTIDGKPWFESPGTRTQRVTTGEHTIAAERPGYLTQSHTVAVAGGKTVVDRITLLPVESAFVERYRHPRWLPWTIAGAGAGIALGGLVFSLLGRRDMDAFSRHFVAECPGGCEADLAMHPDLADELDTAKLEGKVGTTLMITGGAIAAGGIVWAIVNRPKRYMPHVEAAPIRGGASVVARWQF